MPNWIEKTTAGILVCALCGSIVFQMIELFTCSNKFCIKHDDEQVKTYTITQNMNASAVQIGTPSPSAPPVKNS